MIIMLKNKELRFTTKILSAHRYTKNISRTKNTKEKHKCFLLQLFLYKTFMFYT